MVFLTTKLATKPKVNLQIRCNRLEVGKSYLIFVALILNFVALAKYTNLNRCATDLNIPKTYCKEFERTIYPIMELYY